MKFNLKNFPEHACTHEKIVLWKRSFEAELREKLKYVQHCPVGYRHRPSSYISDERLIKEILGE